MRVKMSSIRSRTMRQRDAGGRARGVRPGSVTSTASGRARLAAAAASMNAVQRASIACFSSLA